MMTMFTSLPRWAAALALFSWTDAFVVGPSLLMIRRPLSTTTAPTSPTRIFLENWVADMIDQELYRQSHKRDFETEWMNKNRAAIVQNLSLGQENSEFFMTADDQKEFQQHAKDVRLAKEDPQRYCADRCIATGNCDVYEDFFHMSALQVKSFCTDCVVSDGDEPCDIPESFYDHMNDELNDELRP